MADLDAAFDRIERSVLPTVAAMLDALIDSAAGARPGIDAEAYAAKLRELATQVAAAQSSLAATAAAQEPPAKENRPRALPRMNHAA